jgi:predicted Zn-dependent protease
VAEQPNQAGAVIAWKPAKPEFADRNLALALIGAFEDTHNGDDLRRGYELLKLAHVQPNDSAALAALGSVMLVAKQTKVAVGLYRQASASAPGNATYLRFLGEAELADGHAPDAVTQFERAIQIDPFDRKTYVALAHAYQQLGRKKERAETIERYSTLTGGSQTEIADH